MEHLWLIPALPLAGFALNGTVGKRLPQIAVSLIAVAMPVLSFLWVLKTLSSLGSLETAYIERYFTWIESGALNIGVDFMVDRLTAVMLLVVTGIGSLIHLYAVGYMAHEGGYYRFFAYLNLFMFFMLTLVLGANYLLMFVGWEGVGLCSYLLIGFYFVRKSAADAAKKAFIVNRIGDFGYTLALFLMFVQFGSLDFGKVFAAVAPMPVEHSAGLLTAIALLLFVGATGKSAQIPLYVWLPDAMEGPTPVSALIHAATMVTAGVYMVARSAVIYQHAPLAMEVVAIIGLLTAVLAATIGITQYDIKKVFAYSTVSQLGYMFLACGVGAFAAGIYHVVTHAFFKALLFLGAGSVIHALEGEQDLRQMGGLRKKIPITFAVLCCAWVAIAGIPPFAGYFSKDEILLAAHHHHPWMYWVGVVTAAMTAFYVSRAMFLCFFGQYRGHHHPHESPFIMWGPLAVLAALSLFGGWYFKVPNYLAPLFPLAEGGHEMALVAISVAAGVLGIGVAYVLYVVKPGLADSIASALGGFYKLVYNKYLVDELYDAAVVRPIVHGSRSLLWRVVDVGLIDGCVNGTATLARGVGGVLRAFQSGNIRNYAAWVTLGSVAVLVVLGIAVGGAR
ncbi:MAG: NADH-quinone oxidoreductase subunit L [Bryobacteraceae bacterium]|nr:NADH-quinone oxidoreductase subunit L [Bryobacteraceae bacterium]MDW8379255.1 NADH-quinone oxidoreductase subunit L [Bryobacterales bacterium]